MSKPKKMKSEENDILTRVVATAAIACEGVANGRNIPVAIVEPDIDGKINDLIITHKSVKNGNCECQWGTTEGYEYAILSLSFSSPIEQKIILFFDVIKYGIIVDQILYAKCLFLMTGNSETKFSEHIGEPRILLEVPCDDFQEDWNKIYRKKYVEHLREEYKMSKKEALAIFDDVNNEMQKIKTLRIHK